ncbi:MAG: 50S ribosomal protein L25 [Patescibacteria group bacterium]|jgi:large subunit ribosomal protein L25
MEFKLNVELRMPQEKLEATYIPAVTYGKGIAPASLKVKKLDFDKVFSQAGESNLINLELPSGPVKVIVKAIQRDVLKHTISHVDFFQVNMKEKIIADIPLNFIGESRAVRELGGMLMRSLNEIQVECLPGDLVDHIPVDVSQLNEFSDMIMVKDLDIPEELKVLRNSPEDVVVSVMEPKRQEVIEAEEAAEGETKEAEGAETAEAEEAKAPEAEAK